MCGIFGRHGRYGCSICSCICTWNSEEDSRDVLTPTSNLQSYPYTGFNPNRKFGVEIECVGLTGRVRRELHELGWTSLDIVEDGSINTHYFFNTGGEIRLGPWKASNGAFERLQRVCNILKRHKVSVNVSCGLHVHHDLTQFYSEASPFAVQDVAERLRFTYQRYSKALELMLRPHRWDNEYCLSFVRRDTAALRGGGVVNRYQSVNVPTHHKTVEYRQHQGSVSFKRIKNWIVFTNMLTEYAISKVNMPLFVSTPEKPMREMWDKLILRADSEGVEAKEHYKREIRSLAKRRGSEIPRMVFSGEQLDGCKLPAVQLLQGPRQQTPADHPLLQPVYGPDTFVSPAVADPGIVLPAGARFEHVGTPAPGRTFGSVFDVDIPNDPYITPRTRENLSRLINFSDTLMAQATEEGGN